MSDKPIENIPVGWLPGVNAPCNDCAKAAMRAYSDATTPGFHSPFCDRHRSRSVEPVIEVAPGEPNEHCDYCFTVKPCVLEDSSGRMMCQDCLDKAAASTGAPAVPAQEAPREERAICEKCGMCYLVAHRCIVEPQAGAQELFPGANDMRAPTGMENLRDTPPIVYEGNMAFAQFVGVIEEAEQAGAQVPSQDEMPKATLITNWMPGEANREEYFRSVTSGWRKKCEELDKHLNSIRSYATEAAKTPITREDMHDPLKAQTFYDEAKGFERLVLSETK